MNVRDELVERLLEHVGMVCETGQEGPIADAVQARYTGFDVTRVGNSVVVRGPSGAGPLVALVGHLDVVAPTDEDREPRVEDRDGTKVVVGRGTSDMKGGNVIAMQAFEEHATREERAFDLALVLYAAEEGPAEDNELADVLEQVPWLGEAALAVVLEPTDGQVQLGCLGGLHATITITGRQAHSARPWDGENALTKAGRFLAAFHDQEPVEVTVDGVTYRDVWSMTQAKTSNGRNLVPGSLTLNLNFRFSPSRSLDEAEAEFRRFVADVAESTGIKDNFRVEIVDRAPPAPPHADNPTVARFLEAVSGEIAGKQAWTDVARLAGVGIPACNFGPGRTDQAHQRGEYIEVAAMVDGYERLNRFLSG